MNPGMTHDLQKPVLLRTAGGRLLEPADTTFGSIDGQATTDIWLKFWLDATDLTHTLDLQINDGKLAVKASEGVPQLVNFAAKNFTTNQW